MQCKLIIQNRPLKSSCCHTLIHSGDMEIAAAASEKSWKKKMHFPLINVPELEKEWTFLSERVIEKWEIWRLKRPQWVFVGGRVVEWRIKCRPPPPKKEEQETREWAETRWRWMTRNYKAGVGEFYFVYFIPAPFFQATLSWMVWPRMNRQWLESEIWHTRIFFHNN